jgi:hypothetical protein
MKNFFMFALLALMCVSCSNYSTGERVGIITKFSNSGAMFKSWEGELKIAPNLANSGMVGQYETFHFSLDNDQTIVCSTPTDSIQKYAKHGTPVVVNYQQTSWLNWWNNRGDTQYFVKSVDPVK